MESERYFAGGITVVLADGSRLPARLTADELYAEGKEIYRIAARRPGRFEPVRAIARQQGAAR